MSKLKEMGTPIFWAEGHPGPLTAAEWEVSLAGLVEKPAQLSFQDILALPRTVVDARLTSVSGFTVGGKWGGVHLGELFALVVPDPDASHVQFVSHRKIYTTCLPLEVVYRERTLLAYEFEGQPLETDYGGPVRLFCPYLWGWSQSTSGSVASSLSTKRG